MKALRAFMHALIFVVVAAALLGTGLTGFAVPRPRVADYVESAALTPEDTVASAESLPTPEPTTPTPGPTAVLTPGLMAVPELDQLSLQAIGLRERGSTPGVPTAAPGKTLKLISHTVRQGDSLLGLALKYSVTPETILWANELGNGELLRIDEVLTIPPVSGVVHQVRNGDTVESVAETYCVDPAVIYETNGLGRQAKLVEGSRLIVPGGVQRTTEMMEGMPKPVSAEELTTAPRYTVLAGDNLVSIADSFGVLPSAIQGANGILDPDQLTVGQQLVIPGGKAVPGKPSPSATPSPATPTATAVPPTATSASSGQAPGQGGYVVKSGDTIYSIARSLGVQPQALQDANGLSDPSKLKVGQSLTLPGGARAAQPANAATPTATASPAATSTPAPTKAPTAAPTSTPQPASPTARPQSTATVAAAAKPAATLPPAPPAQPVGNPANGQRVAAIAQKYIGYRYVWGGHSPTGFDCTGFTWYVYREAGLKIPDHDLPGQLNAGPKIPREQLAPGDLVFFQNTYMAGLSHVGIYLGGGRFVNAETEKVGVQVRALTDPYWSSRFVGASRPW